MDIDLQVLLILEMFLVNLYVMTISSKGQTTPLKTLLILTVYTIGLIGMTYLFVTKVFPAGNHNGVFLLFGFLYLLPSKILYDQPLKYSLAITCTSWLHTLFLLSLAIRVAPLLNEAWSDGVMLLTLTLLYILTLPFFISSLKRTTYALGKIDDEMLTNFIVLGSLWFLSYILLNTQFDRYDSDWFEFVITLVLALCTILSYKVFYSLIVISNTAKELTKRTKTDILTGLKNRDAFFRDAQKRLESRKPFSIVFIDLDQFKQVNDRYGHAEGDRYLVQFADVLRQFYNDQGTLYRLSGDEFVFLYLGRSIVEFCSQLETRIIPAYKNKIRFKGLSLGYASFPKDGEDLNSLLKTADHNMYLQKKVKHFDRSL
ncbi:diguanylate cyclase (GGDEF) domain-containing protein [Desulfitobacterium dichloroeliminans LMG P-21439]|uniref:Diguanylate cyclase (GGDEF) domain-containing protein n=1 Tax=Desulfitobacterium dichloroeliminans (strain LMG P-21439 / DCA1) TaxID=871963 RepID=L0F7Q9_DESDL|nr:GGDEF domain-containing protein [Desulfitobacterium dichloroeliminans]AGA69040.1 diguanylate cyclase (GGDEF) domain-containing protein [Desulfitobacterium dichloroeliminans LMG P-21439]